MILCNLNIGLTESGRKKWQKAEETRKDFNIVLINRDEIIYLRGLQGHSGRNLSDHPSLQYNVLIPNDFFEYIHHVGCAINLQSIMNSGLIPGGQNLSTRQTVFFTSVDPTDNEQGTPRSWFNRPQCTIFCIIQAENVEETSKHVPLVDIKLAQKKGFKFYQTRSNVIIHYDTLPAYWIPKAIMMESGQIIYEKVCVTSTSSKDFLQRQVDERIGFRSCWRWQRLPTNPTKDQNSIVRTERLVLSEQQSGSSVQEIENVSNLAAKAPMKEQGNLFSSCVPVYVKRLEQDKDADENVDADHVRTVRLVKKTIHRFVHTARGDRHWL